MVDAEKAAYDLLLEIIKSGQAKWLDFVFNDEIDAAQKSAVATAVFLKTLSDQMKEL